MSILLTRPAAGRLRVRKLAQAVAKEYYASRERLGFPMLPKQEEHAHG